MDVEYTKKEASLMDQKFRMRIFVLTTLILVGLGILISRVYQFQIERRNEFLKLMPSNRTIEVRLPGSRGEITDKNGVVLAKNKLYYQVQINLDEVAQAYKDLYARGSELSRILPSDVLAGKRKESSIVKIFQEILGERLAQLKLSVELDERAMEMHYLTHSGFIPYIYRHQVNEDEIARYAEHHLELPGVYVAMNTERVYPMNALASHVLGYVRDWDKKHISEAERKSYQHFIGDSKGVAGVEATMDPYLKGTEGRKVLVKNDKNRLLNMRDFTKPGQGAQVQLTMDARIQYLTENVLRNVGRAAAVVMNVNTGEIIAMASVPDYNPNDFIPSITKEKFDFYTKNKRLSPLVNRAISDYTPGSTYKVATAVAGCIAGLEEKYYSCDGYITFGNHRLGCWIWNMKKGSHGAMNLSKALQQSCNPYFNKMANAMGVDAMVKGFELVGMGSKTGVELLSEKSGMVPGSATWQRSYPRDKITPALNAMFSIGQGDSLATPLQLCAMTSCIANGGRYYKPRIVKQVVRQNGEVVVQDEPYLVRDLLQLGISKKNLKMIHKGMFMSVNEAGGTASTAKMKDVIVAAKTGTAQTMDQGKKSNHSWMIAFAPYEKPKYAICLMVENAGSGGKVCGPMVHEMFTGIFNQEKGEKLPLAAQTSYEGYLKRIEEVVLNHLVPENTIDQSEEASGGLIEDEDVEIIDLPQKSMDQDILLNESE